MQEYLNMVFWGNTILRYLVFLVSLIIGFFGLRFIRLIIQKSLKKLTKNTNFELKLIDLFAKSMVPILFCFIFFLSTLELTLDPTLRLIVNRTMFGFSVFLIAWMLSSATSLLIGFLFENHFNESKEKSMANAIQVSISIVVWTFAMILLFDNLGLNITSLLAGLGIGGVALAFSAQSILIDLFCWFTIFFDKPFVVGDFITLSDKSGTVEHIGVKTTRLRSKNGEQIIIANSDLTKSRINNFKTLVERRAFFKLCVTYTTSSTKLKLIPELIKALVEDTPNTRFERTHFVTYGPYSLDFEVVYFVLSDDYMIYLNTLQEINFKIKEAFEKAQIEFAYPTQTLQIQKANQDPSLLD